MRPPHGTGCRAFWRSFWTTGPTSNTAQNVCDLGDRASPTAGRSTVINACAQQGETERAAPSASSTSLAPARLVPSAISATIWNTTRANEASAWNLFQPVARSTVLSLGFKQRPRVTSEVRTRTGFATLCCVGLAPFTRSIAVEKHHSILGYYILWRAQPRALGRAAVAHALPAA